MAERPVRPHWLFVGAVVVALATLIVVPHPFARGVILGVLLTVTLLLGAGFMLRRRLKGRLQQAMKPPPIPTTQWDSRLKARGLDGEIIDFADLSGRVLVLNFWATTCAPCVAEMPSLVDLESATSDQDVFVACLTREPKEKVERFVAGRGLSAPIYLLDGESPECFQTRAIPATFVLDRDHRIVFRHVGAADWGAPSVVSFVRGLTMQPSL